ncbi:TetR/AcrR family transcriptional regulator [Kribbella ginsengisoli]|uniref:TetR/AcrR family transcriptional regulator n=1 Tax=Kribbella ginsengisoli TaxID=363865 RepID=A0ABP6VY08_9ACTN
MDLETEPVRRRRGAELEQALLAAAWDELIETGYAALTIDAVAHRAGTSRPVIYRRWPTKADLVRAAVDHRMLRDLPLPPDTGSLRGDLIELMHFANQHRAGFTVLLTYYLGPYFQETGTSPADLRENAFQDRATGTDVILDRAAARGELDPACLTPRIRSLPFDLYRHEALMTLKPVPDDVITEIVDEIFLPLVRSIERESSR